MRWKRIEPRGRGANPVELLARVGSVERERDDPDRNLIAERTALSVGADTDGRHDPKLEGGRVHVAMRHELAHRHTGSRAQVELLEILHGPTGSSQLVVDDLTGLFFGCGHGLVSGRPLGAGFTIRLEREISPPIGFADVCPG